MDGIPYYTEKTAKRQMETRKTLTFRWKYGIILLARYAAVAELADARDLKSLAGNSVPVRSRSAALKKQLV